MVYFFMGAGVVILLFFYFSHTDLSEVVDFIEATKANPKLHYTANTYISHRNMILENTLLFARRVMAAYGVR